MQLKWKYFFWKGYNIEKIGPCVSSPDLLPSFSWHQLSLLALHVVVYPDVYMMVIDSPDLIAISSLLRAKIHL